MIGNDIIDLEFAKRNSRWQEQRFLDKLFTFEEQDFIFNDSNRFQNIWRLWSMKESAYKIISRADGIVRFNPRDYRCDVINSSEGVVNFDSATMSTLTLINYQYIQTTGFLKSNWTSQVFQLRHVDSKLQHVELCDYVVKTYSDLKHIPKNLVEIRKNDIGIPQLYVEGISQKAQVSLTHHGHFGAVVIAV